MTDAVSGRCGVCGSRSRRFHRAGPAQASGRRESWRRSAAVTGLNSPQLAKAGVLQAEGRALVRR